MNNINNKTNNRQDSVAFFPSVQSLSVNPYWPILVRELEKKGVNFEYDTPSSFGFAWLFKNRKKINILNIHFFQQFYKSNTFIKKIIKVVLFGFKLILARLLGFRTVFTLHNLEPTYEMKPAWLDFVGHWMAANFSERVIVYCQESKKLLKKKYGRRKNTFYVDHPNLVEFYPNEISKKLAREQLGLNLESFVFTFIGGVRPNKGVEVLINAFRKLSDEKLRLVVAGKIFPPENYATSLKELAKGDDRIIFNLKHINDDEFQIFLNAADIVVLPFTKILTSGTANLAMSFGKPVIVPRIGCLPELIESDCGWLFDPDDSDSLAEIMQIALTSDVESAGKKANAKLIQCTPERFAEQTIKAYWGR